MDGASPRDKLVAFRVNAEEDVELQRKMACRGVTDKSAYFRSRIEEDTCDQP